MFERIVVAVGPDERAEEALRLVGELAKALGSSVVVLHVHQSHDVRVGAYPFEPRSEAERELDLMARAETFVEEASGRLRVLGVDATPALRSASYGRVAKAILDEATEAHADLIVIASGGRPAAASRLLGGVTQDVLRAAPCPVLTIR